MPRNILIDPQRLGTGNPNIQFSGSLANTIKLEVLTSGSVHFTGVSGSLLSVVDSLSGSLFAVSDISGLPILEAFSDDRVVMGRFNTNALVVTGSIVGIGTSTPVAKLDVRGAANTYTLSVSGSSTFGQTFGQIINAGSNSGDVSLRVRNYDGSSEYLFVRGDGNVGIGTATNFAGKLHVYGGNLHMDGTAGANSTSTYSNAAYARLVFDNDYSDVARGPNRITLHDGAGSWVAGFGIHSNTVGYYSGATHAWYTMTSATPTQYMSLTSTGALLPGSNNAQDIGSTSLYWRNLYVSSVSGTFTGSNLTAGQVVVAGTGGLISGSNNFWWDNANGRVGIGTASPSEKLHINSAASIPARLVSSAFSGIEYHNVEGTWKVYVGTENGGGGARYNSADSQHTFYNNGTNVLRINSSGNVGIGTTQLDSRLVVNGNSVFSGSVLPDGDNTRDLGSSTKRWANLYATNVVSSGSLGPAYTSPTSTSGTTAIFDTISVTSDGNVYELMIIGNPNSNSSTAYRDIIYGKIIIGTGHNGSAVRNYIQFVAESPAPRSLYGANGNGPLTADVVYLQSSTEYTDIAQGGAATIRVKVAGYTAGYVGNNTTVRIKQLA